MGICNSSTKEDVKRDRERTRASQQPPQSSVSTSGVANPSGDRARGSAPSVSVAGSNQIPKPAPPGSGLPPGSYRDANGIPRSIVPEQAIASSYKGGNVDGGEYGTSYTNRKTKEYDLLNDIVKQTRNNFIDVSAKGGQLDEDDLLERGQKYVKNLNEIPSLSQLSAPAASSASATAFGQYYSALELPQPSAIIVKRSVHIGSGLSSGLAQTRSTAAADVDYNALIALVSHASIAPIEVEFAQNSSAQLSSAILDSATLQEPTSKIVLTFEELLHDK